jgi:Holliday junction resolvase
MHNAKTDANQKEIVDALRKAGFSVQCLSTVGKGFPDLLVGFDFENHLIEVKDGLKAKLNDDQVIWHSKWNGQVHVIHNMEELTNFIKMFK